MERTRKKLSLAWLNKLCHIPLDSGAEQEVHRQEIMISVLMLTGSVVITAMSLWDIFFNSGPHWGNITTLSVGLLAAICYNIALLTARTSLCVTLGMMLFLHFFWLITCDVDPRRATHRSGHRWREGPRDRPDRTLPHGRSSC